jgi:nucleotide-binding universal stress UspA family protein
MSTSEAAIVVGYDGSPDAGLALEWAEATSSSTGAPLRVVVVGSAMDPVVGHFREHEDELVAACSARATVHLRRSGNADAEVEVRRGPVVPVLRAVSHGAAALVVGSRGHGLAVGSVTGSVTQHLARHASCPVVVVRPAHQPDARRIVVGVDGSGGSEAALRFACARGNRTGEEVLAVHAHRAPTIPSGRAVLTGAMAPGPVPSTRDMASREAAERLLAAATAGVRVEMPAWSSPRWRCRRRRTACWWT